MKGVQKWFLLLPRGTLSTSMKVYLARLGYVYLNGLLIEWQEGSDMVGVSKKVGQRGDAWDDTLNTNNTVTISAVSAGTLSVSGSNPG